MHLVFFSVWLLLLSIIILRFIHPVYYGLVLGVSSLSPHMMDKVFPGERGGPVECLLNVWAGFRGVHSPLLGFLTLPF